MWKTHIRAFISKLTTTMASEPSSASEPSTSTSEIQTDTSELEVLALNYLRDQEISTIPAEFRNSILAVFSKE
jgi:hypothetical protein